MTLWDVSTGAYRNSYYVGGLDANPWDVFFKPDGTILFVLGATSETIYKFSLSTPWNITTASLVNTFDVGSEIDYPTGMFFKPNGYQLFVVGHGTVEREPIISQYFLVNWFVGSATYLERLNVSDICSYVTGVYIEPTNGTKMYVLEAGSRGDRRIFQYELSIPWHVSTGDYTGKSLFVGDQAFLPYGIHFKPEGDVVYVTASLEEDYEPRVFQFTLSTPWNISTGGYSGKSLYVGTQEENAAGLYIKPDGNRLFIAGRLNDSIHQYILPEIPVVTTQEETDVAATSITGNGNITEIYQENVTRRGFCYIEGTTGNPTTSDSVAYDDGSFGTGAYSKSITGLNSATNYRVRAYAVNSVGVAYGDTVQVLTLSEAPTNVQATDGDYTDKVVVTWTKSEGATGYQVYRAGTPLGWLENVDTYDDTEANAPTITPGSVTASDGSSTAHVALSNTEASSNNGTTHTYKVVAKNDAGESDDSETDTGYRGVGTLTYQWYKSAEDNDANYSIISGAVASTYNDNNAPAPTITPGSVDASDGSSFDYVSLSISGKSANVGEGRYYKCYHIAEGVTPGYTGTNRGYRGVGSLTYQWQRSAGDSDADYSNISGATSNTHNDTDAPIPTITPGIAIASDGAYAAHVALSLSGQSADGEGRYYICVLNADGCDEETSTSDRGYRSVGDLTYQWQRSAADSDASYSNISGATAATYNDTGAPSDGSGRYYKCVEDATGADQQISTSDRGHRITWATVTTQAVTDIGEFSAVGNGTITDIGYEHCSKRGVCWNTTGSPTVSDDISEETDSFGTGAFTRLMASLTANTTYYVKGYAYNSAGYSYGGEVGFTTETTQAATVVTLTPTLVEDGIANLILALISKDDLIINPVGWYCDENAAPSTEYIETGWKAGGGGADLALGIYSKYVKTLPTGHSTLYVQAWCDDDSSNRYTGSILSFDIPSEPEYTELPDIIFPEFPEFPELPDIILPEIPAIEIDLPNINYNIGLDLYLDRTYTRKDLEELRRKCINYEKNYTDFCLILNHNTLLVKNFLQSAYNNGILGGENEMFIKIHPSQQLTPLYLEPLEPNDFKGIINRFINNNTSNSMGLNHNFDLFKEWLNDYDYTSDGYKASYITPKEEIITNNEPTVKYLTNKVNRLQREVSTSSREIMHNFNLIKEIIQ